MFYRYSFLLLAPLVASKVFQIPSSCNGVVNIRPEWYSLTADLKQAFVDGIICMYENGSYERYAKKHYQYKDLTHGTKMFPFWHRVFLIEFEKELRTCYKQKFPTSKITPILPYWDWARESDTYGLSDVWKWLGTADKEKCVSKGPFANWKCNNACISRNFVPGQIAYGDDVLYASEFLSLTISKHPTFYDYSSELEYTAHANFHVRMGGRSGQIGTMFSPCDPVFYLHHAFIDKLIQDNLDFDPDQRIKDENFKDTGISLDTVIPGFEKYKVRDVVLVLNQCYAYVNPNTAIVDPTKIEPPAVKPGSNETSDVSSEDSDHSAGKPENKRPPVVVDPPVILPRRNSSDNYTIPAPLTEEQCKKMGYKVEIVRKFEKNVVKIYQVCEEKRQKGERVYGPGVKDGKGYDGLYPPTSLPTNSGTINEDTIKKIVPTYGEKYGAGVFGDTSLASAAGHAVQFTALSFATILFSVVF